MPTVARVALHLDACEMLSLSCSSCVPRSYRFCLDKQLIKQYNSEYDSLIPAIKNQTEIEHVLTGLFGETTLSRSLNVSYFFSLQIWRDSA